jgi:hypothetical protein
MNVIQFWRPHFSFLYNVLTKQRVDKVISSKSTGHQDGHVLAVGSMNGNVAADMGKDLSVAHSLKRQLTPVGVSSD